MSDPFLVLTTPVPEVGDETAARILAEHFGIASQLEPLASERDRNFLVTREGGEKLVLKIANSAEAAAVTALQSDALLHVAQTDPALAAPRAVASLDGAHCVAITAEDGRRHLARVVTWVQGTPLELVPRETGFAVDFGRLAARVARALEGFSHPAADYALLWDLKRASRLRDLLKHVADEDLRSLCDARLDRFESRVAARLAELPSQVIHNDLNPSNVLVDADSPTQMLGVIDFGDIARSPRIVDVAVAAAYLLKAGPTPFADVLDFVDAWHGVAPLAEQELDILVDLALTRCAMTVLITHWRAARYPDNRDYILRSETRARRLLEELHDSAVPDFGAELNKRT